jgi:hypothetical protein
MLTFPGMTWSELVTYAHSWMAGTSPAMTINVGAGV